MTPPKATPREPSRADLEREAERVQAWWHARGRTAVRVWVEPGESYTLPHGARVTPHRVRSNLVGGLPPEEAR